MNSRGKLKNLLFSLVKNCCIIDTQSGTNLHHNSTSQSHHQEAIQFRAAENVINQDHELGSNHGPPDSQDDRLVVELARSLSILFDLKEKEALSVNLISSSSIRCKTTKLVCHLGREGWVSLSTKKKRCL